MDYMSTEIDMIVSTTRIKHSLKYNYYSLTILYFYLFIHFLCITIAFKKIVTKGGLNALRLSLSFNLEHGNKVVLGLINYLYISSCSTNNLYLFG